MNYKQKIHRSARLFAASWSGLHAALMHFFWVLLPVIGILSVISPKRTTPPDSEMLREFYYMDIYVALMAPLLWLLVTYLIYAYWTATPEEIDQTSRFTNIDGDQ